MSRPLESQSAHAITQFLRGSHPFYIDFLLSCRYPDRESLQAALLYQQAHLEFTGKYLEHYDATFQKVLVT